MRDFITQRVRPTRLLFLGDLDPGCTLGMQVLSRLVGNVPKTQYHID
ncbi:MAG: hypothetical protein IPK92_00545 [Nitrospira sp.]|nr:hypothetical protein [Nitrospira sp.]